MRLDRLRIPHYNNLQMFEIDFDEDEPTTVILGRNGTGKSNLFEAVVEIFRELELGKPTSFAYTLDYVCHGHAIHIDANPDSPDKRLDIAVDGNSISVPAFKRRVDVFLPSYVFAYYSGWSSRLERHFDRPTRSHYERVLKSPNRELPLRRMFFCRKEYSQLVLLAFFLSPSEDARNVLRRHLGISQFESALFALKTPWWGKGGSPSKARLADGDSRFWYARGAFRGFLNRLWTHALAPIRNPESVERDVRRKPEATERLYLFIKNESELASLREPDEDSKTLFGYLESLFLCDLIDEVRVTVERTDGSRVKFTQLSEGEQQLLTVLGLLLFTQKDESLYLLDEPDTHLNPVWTYDFLQLLQENLSAEKSHLLVSTHNPLMIGSLHKNQVRLLKREDDDVTAVEPEYDPLGIGVEGLLKSELYGLRSTLAPEVLTKLDRHYALLGKVFKTHQEQTELMNLAAELNDLGVSRTHPNPYFELFANAMAMTRSAQSKLTLSKEEIEDQARLADEILEQMLDAERSRGMA